MTMKKVLIGLSALMALAGVYLVQTARAGITCSLPFQLQNNTTADATQVMANYNALVTCFTSAAAAGINADITALTALTTPLTPAQGGTGVYYGGVSAGTANAQTVTVVTPSTGFTLTAGRVVQFIVGAALNNTDATTLNVNATGATPIFRQTILQGIGALVGGELRATSIVTVMYDGTQWQLISRTPDRVGEIVDYTVTGSVAGYTVANGGCLSTTGAGAALFALIGNTYGTGCPAGQFLLPDLNGRSTAGANAGRLPVACVGVATACGGSTTLTNINQFPSANLPVTDPTHDHVQHGSTAYILGSGQVSQTTTTFAVNASAGQVTEARATGISVGTGGSSQPIATSTPTLIVNKLIKL